MIVVTGGAGFIGSCIVQALNDKGITDILVVDRLHSGEKWKNLVGLSFTDYLDKEVFLKNLASGKYDGKLEGFFHMGACSATTQMDADYLMVNNYQYTKTLAQYAVKNNLRFIYASSAATYGEGEQGYSDNAKLLTLSPLNPYGYSKHLFDTWAEQNGFLSKIVGLKFFNVYGPNEAHKDDMRSVIHKSYGQILETGKVKLFKSHRDEYEDGGQLRDFIYVKDAVSVAMYLYDNSDQNGLFNVGTGKAQSFRELAEATFKAMGKKPNIEYIDMPEQLQPRYQYYTQAEMEKLRKTGYDQKFYNLENGVDDYVKNHLMK
ncbi:MAG: ADP-L-glycero-D-manno-heptose 6-epimerase [bacterium]|jgi:ADP-L-glycero-D-manno-heptose 6-epimerase